MSARAVISGMLAKPPERRVSKANRPYLICTIRDDETWWRVFVFNEADVETLQAMSVGEPLCAAGVIEARVWSPEGREPRVSLSMIADAILTARKRPKPRQPTSPERQPAAAPIDEGRPLNDDLPPFI
jgi:hypothetical protein